MEIKLEGQTTIISVNGKVVNTFESSQSVPERKRYFEPRRGPRPDSGYIGLQNHDEESVVLFKGGQRDSAGKIVSPGQPSRRVARTELCWVRFCIGLLPVDNLAVVRVAELARPD